MEVVSTSNSRPNWMLRVLFGVSAGVHILILLYGSGLYRPEIILPIELTVQQSEPPKRAIPKTPVRTPLPDPPEQAPDPLLHRVLHRAVRPVPAAPADPVKAEPIPSPLPLTATKVAAAPKLEPLSIPELRVSRWTPENAPEKASRDSPAPTFKADPAPAEAKPAAREHYLNAIRRKIEQRKKYPEAARRSQFQGKVVVEFVLTPSGDANSIRVVEGCRFDILNRAAIRAVEDASPFPKPPEGLVSGSLSLRIPIVFKLI